MLKFKLYDENKNEIVNYINCSVTLDAGEVQSFDKKGNLEGTMNNRHLKVLQYTGKRDINNKEIYGGFIVRRKGAVIGEEDIVGAVVFDECQWWIKNEKEQTAVPLFSETAEDKIIGNIYQSKELTKLIRVA